MAKTADDTKSYSNLKTVIFGAIIVILTLAVCLCIKYFVITNYTVKMRSMEPTYKEGDVVWVLKLKRPTYGDVVIVKHEDSNTNEALIKRAVAFGGDLIWVEPNPDNINQFYLCRQKSGNQTREYLLTETYGDTTVALMQNDSTVGLVKTELLSDAIGFSNAFEVPQNTVYCLGDNRQSSIDSREYGPFDASAVVGVVVGEGMTVVWVLVVLGCLLMIVLIICIIVGDKSKQKLIEDTILPNGDLSVAIDNKDSCDLADDAQLCDKAVLIDNLNTPQNANQKVATDFDDDKKAN